MGEPNSRFGQHEQNAMESDIALPAELEALAQRLSADAASWQSRIGDPIKLANHIREISMSTPRTPDDSMSSPSAPASLPPQGGQRTQSGGGPPTRPGPQRGRTLLATIAAVLVVGLLAVVLVQIAQQRGSSTGPIGQPTQTQAVPTATTPPTATPTAKPPTPTPTKTWTTIQGYTGSGNYKTGSFQVTSPWRLVWQCNLSMGNAGPYPLKATMYPSAGGTGTPAIDTTCKTGSTSGTGPQESTPSGLVYLSISSAADGEWDVRVQVLR